MPTQSAVVTQMMQALAITEPTLDTSIGSPVRALLDVVAETIAEQTADQYLISYTYDVYSKTGADLDAFVSVFGMTRFPAKRAVGYVTFSRATPAPNDILFGAGTQVSNTASPPLLFSTIIPAILPQGGTSVTIPVQAVIAGAAGNVAATSITVAVSPLMGISSVTNTAGLTGGTDQESDTQLQTRFVNTVFRALVGTSSMYLGTAIDDPSVSVANIIGATEVWNEQIQLVGGVGLSSVQNLAYLYPNTAFLGTNIFTGNIFSPGVQFTCTSELISNPAFSSISHSGSGGSIPLGSYTYALALTTIAGTTSIGALSTVATTGSSSTITVNWSAPTTYLDDVVSYQIYRLTSGLFEEVVSIPAYESAASYGSPTALNTITTLTLGSAAIFLTGGGSGSVLAQDGAMYSFTYGGVSGATLTTFSCSSTATIVTGNQFWPGALTHTDTALGTPLGIPAVLNTTGTPIVRSLDSINVPDGVYQLQYDYLSSSSRNDPINGITNRIDIYINGSRPVECIQNFMSSNEFNFNGTDPTDVASAPTSLNVALFQRLDGTEPAVTDVFMPVAFTPVSGIGVNGLNPEITPGTYTNGTLTGNTTWVYESNYWLVNDISQWGESSLSRGGVEFSSFYGPNRIAETFTSVTGAFNLTTDNITTSTILIWDTTASTSPLVLNTDYTVTTSSGVTTITPTFGTHPHPVSGEQWLVEYSYPLNLTIDYYYNQVPSAVQQAIENWRIVTTDVMVHQAQYNYLDMFFSVLLGPSITPANILSAVETAVSNYLSSLTFDSVVQVSEILSVIQQVSGITAVRFLNSGDSALVLYGTGPLNGDAASTHYAMQTVNSTTDTVITTHEVGGRAVDVYLSDNTLGALNNLYLVQQAQNTFGAV